jgi:cytosine/uracil/thiamine/allantoin permease
LLDFALVRRGKIYFDDLYSLKGIYGGVLGFSPAGFAAIAAGAVTYFAARHLGEPFAAGTATCAWLLAQLVFGSVEHTIRERK